MIADSEPGLYDEHCHRLPTGPFHDCLPPQGSSTRQVGKGKLILYRGLGSGYVKARGYGFQGTAEATADDEARRESSKLLAMLTDQAGLRPGFRFCDAQGRDTRAHTLTAMDYVDGQARYVACVAKGTYGRTLHARLSIPGAGHLYECRTGKYLGAAGTHGVELQVATGNLFALLPYRVERMDVTLPAHSLLGQPIQAKATLVTSGGPPVRHVVVLQLRRPDGRDLREHRWIVETDTGIVDRRLFLALNDPVGTWALVARDVATGVEKTTPIDIQAGAANY